MTLVPSCNCTKISDRKLGSERKSVVCAKITASDCCASLNCLSHANPKLLKLRIPNSSDKAKNLRFCCDRLRCTYATKLKHANANNAIINTLQNGRDNAPESPATKESMAFGGSSSITSMVMFWAKRKLC